MKHQLLISVIVPVYNVEKYLSKCIDSIVGQVYKNIEVILVDDGSQDSSGDICDLWAGRDSRIKVCHKANGGLVSARKAGLAISQGDYIAYVDGDDWIEPQMYGHMAEVAAVSRADMVTSGIIRDYKDHTVVEQEGFQKGVYKGERLEQEYWPNVVAADTFFRTNMNIHITNKLFERGLALEHQNEVSDQIRIGEDAAMVYPAVFDSKCVAVTGKSFYHYRICFNSMMDFSGKLGRDSEYIEKRFADVVGRKKEKIPQIERQLSIVMLYNRLFTDPKQVIQMRKGVLYPFKKLGEGERVIVYGSGRFGRRLFLYMKKTGCCKVTAWCDKTAGDGIISIEEALQHPFDKIVIAVLIADIADEIEGMLINRKISKDKICRVEVYDDDV